MKKYADEIEPRHLHFQFLPTHGKYWHGGSAVKTYHFNALAHFLPSLEKLLVLSLKKTLPLIKAPTLKKQVASLIAQEAIHGREFTLYNKILIEQHFTVKMSQLSLFRIMAALFNKFSNSFHCALSAAGEHFTAIAADLFLRDPHWFEGVDPDISAIWRWHCIEEIEHKSVAFDVFKALNGNYFIRIAAMILMTGFFTSLYFKPIWQMMKQDQKHLNCHFYREAFRYYWGKGGLCRALLKPYFDYFRPGFHPTKHQNDHLIEGWKAFLKKASPNDIKSGLTKIHPPFTS